MLSELCYQERPCSCHSLALLLLSEHPHGRLLLSRLDLFREVGPINRILDLPIPRLQLRPLPRLTHLLNPLDQLVHTLRAVSQRHLLVVVPPKMIELHLEAEADHLQVAQVQIHVSTFLLAKEKFIGAQEASIENTPAFEAAASLQFRCDA